MNLHFSMLCSGHCSHITTVKSPLVTAIRPLALANQNQPRTTPALVGPCIYERNHWIRNRSSKPSNSIGYKRLQVRCTAVVPSIVQEAATTLATKVAMYGCAAVVTLFVAERIGQLLRQDVKRQKSRVGSERSKYFAWEAIIAALELPLRYLIPSVAGLLSAREVGRFFLILKPEIRQQFAPTIRFLSRSIDDAHLLTLNYTKVLGVIIAGFVVLSIKSLARSRLCDMVAEAQDIDRADVKRALAPISSLLDVVILGAVLLGITNTIGFNLQPFLGTFGAIGVISGLASKSFAANIVSGIHLLLTRPFVPGDRIMVKGAANVHGVVEKIDFNRTQVRQDNLLPVIIPNGILQDSVIINETRSGNTSIRNNYHGPRLLDFDIYIPYRYMDKVADITARLRNWLRDECSLVDNRRIVAYPASIKNLDINRVCINISVFSTTPGSRAFAAFREQVLINVFRIVRSCGATVTTYQVNTRFNYNMGQVPEGTDASSAPWTILQPPQPTPQEPLLPTT